MAINVVHTSPAVVSNQRPLLFVHGAWHASWCWTEHFLPWFTERGFACHAIDLRGHGQSTNTRSLRFTRIRHYVDDVHHVVDQLTREPIIVGHSMGGLVVQRLLERIDLPGAVLLAPDPVGGAWRATLRVLRHHPMAFVKANLTWSLWPIVSSEQRSRDLLFGDDMSDAEVRRLHCKLQDESYLAYLDMLLMVRPRPPLVHTPVEVIAGSSDRIFGVEELRKTAKAYGAPLHVVEGAAHDLMLGRQWRQVAELIASFAQGEAGNG